jgi:hypothetical protein
MSRIKDIDSLYNFIGYVVLCAPDQFPQRDYLRAEEQMNLEGAFAELSRAIALVERDFPGADEQRGLSTTLSRALACYKDGDTLSGAHALQDFQDLIFKT